MSSPSLIRRDREVAELSTAIARAGMVLVSGDAGTGKTRLIREAVDRASAGGTLAVVGGCVQLGEASVPFAPRTEALRAIRRAVGVEEFAAADVIGLLAGQAAGGPGSSASLFAHLLELFTQLGNRRGLLVVFEDMHWADASTRDLVAFLARNLTGTTTSMVLTYRTDDVHRRHPLRGLLSELERSSVVDRVDVGALPREGLGRLVVELTHGSSRHMAHRRGSDPGAPRPIALNVRDAEAVRLLPTTRRQAQRGSVVLPMWPPRP